MTTDFLVIGIIFAVLGILYYLATLPWTDTWRCTRCGMEFDSEEAARGHTVIHSEHKTSIIN